MLSQQKNSFLLLEILVCFFLLSLTFPLIYPIFQARRQQVQKWKRLRTLQEEAELSFLQARLRLEEVEIASQLKSAQGEAFYISLPQKGNIHFPFEVQVQEQLIDQKESFVEVSLQYPDLQNKESIEFRQIFCLKKN